MSLKGAISQCIINGRRPQAESGGLRPSAEPQGSASRALRPWLVPKISRAASERGRQQTRGGQEPKPSEGREHFRTQAPTLTGDMRLASGGRAVGPSPWRWQFCRASKGSEATGPRPRGRETEGHANSCRHVSPLGRQETT